MDNNSGKIALDGTQTELFKRNVKLAVYEKLLDEGLITPTQFNALCDRILKKGEGR